jgi:hypothetical protein
MGFFESDVGHDCCSDGGEVTARCALFVAAKANESVANVKPESGGRSHNTSDANRMLDTTVALMEAK